jgi:hypothetical protein
MANKYNLRCVDSSIDERIFDNLPYAQVFNDPVLLSYLGRTFQMKDLTTGEIADYAYLIAFPYGAPTSKDFPYRCSFQSAYSFEIPTDYYVLPFTVYKPISVNNTAGGNSTSVNSLIQIADTEDTACTGIYKINPYKTITFPITQSQGAGYYTFPGYQFFEVPQFLTLTSSIQSSFQEFRITTNWGTDVANSFVLPPFSSGNERGLMEITNIRDMELERKFNSIEIHDMNFFYEFVKEMIDFLGNSQDGVTVFENDVLYKLKDTSLHVPNNDNVFYFICYFIFIFLNNPSIPSDIFLKLNVGLNFSLNNIKENPIEIGYEANLIYDKSKSTDVEVSFDKIEFSAGDSLGNVYLDSEKNYIENFTLYRDKYDAELFNVSQPQKYPNIVMTWNSYFANDITLNPGNAGVYYLYRSLYQYYYNGLYFFPKDCIEHATVVDSNFYSKGLKDQTDDLLYWYENEIFGQNTSRLTYLWFIMLYTIGDIIANGDTLPSYMTIMRDDIAIVNTKATVTKNIIFREFLAVNRSEVEGGYKIFIDYCLGSGISGANIITGQSTCRVTNLFISNDGRIRNDTNITTTNMINKLGTDINSFYNAGSIEYFYTDGNLTKNNFEISYLNTSEDTNNFLAYVNAKDIGISSYLSFYQKNDTYNSYKVKQNSGNWNTENSFVDGKIEILDIGKTIEYNSNDTNINYTASSSMDLSEYLSFDYFKNSLWTGNVKNINFKDTIFLKKDGNIIDFTPQKNGYLLDKCKVSSEYGLPEEVAYVWAFAQDDPDASHAAAWLGKRFKINSTYDYNLIPPESQLEFVKITLQPGEFLIKDDCIEITRNQDGSYNHSFPFAPSNKFGICRNSKILYTINNTSGLPIDYYMCVLILRQIEGVTTSGIEYIDMDDENYYRYALTDNNQYCFYNPIPTKKEKKK